MSTFIMMKRTIADQISKQGYRVFHLGAIALMVLAIADLNGRYRRIDEKRVWLGEQREKLSNNHIWGSAFRQKRDVKAVKGEKVNAILSKLDSFEFR